MRLVVIGGYSLDYLQEHVVKSFSDIPCQADGGGGLDEEEEKELHEEVARTPPLSWETKYVSPLTSAGMPFTPAASLGKVFYLAPVKDRHSLSVTWQLPSQMSDWRTKPCEYLAHLLGHEAKGSLLASLKAKSWVTASCAGVGSEGYEVRDSFSVRHERYHTIVEWSGVE
jgi:nardilysin